MCSVFTPANYILLPLYVSQLELFLAKASLQLQLGHTQAFADSLTPHISHLLQQMEDNAAILAAATKVRQAAHLFDYKKCKHCSLQGPPVLWWGSCITIEKRMRRWCGCMCGAACALSASCSLRSIAYASVGMCQEHNNNSSAASTIPE